MTDEAFCFSTVLLTMRLSPCFTGDDSFILSGHNKKPIRIVLRMFFRIALWLFFVICEAKQKGLPSVTSLHAPQVGLEPTTLRLTAECSAIELLRNIGIRRRPTLPDRYQSSTIGTEGLNFCVRYGNRWDPFVIATGNGELLYSSREAKPSLSLFPRSGFSGLPIFLFFLRQA